MLVKLLAGQASVERAIAELSRNGASTGIADAALAHLIGLTATLATADATTLAALGGEIGAAVKQTQVAVAQARDQAAVETSLAAVAEAASTSRAAVSNAMEASRHFQLTFTSAADEAEYRRREDERRGYIAAEQAKHTPQGDLNAAGGAVGQMADAAAHGATADPQFKPKFDALMTSTQALRDQLLRDGKDVSQFDAHLREDLRSIMRAKGVPDAQIDAMLAAHRDNPLEAVKAFVAEQKGVIGEKEIDDLSRKARDYKDGVENAQATLVSSTPASPMVDAMAKLKASGVVMAENTAEPAHGVSAQVAALTVQSRSP